MEMSILRALSSTSSHRAIRLLLPAPCDAMEETPMKTYWKLIALLVVLGSMNLLDARAEAAQGRVVVRVETSPNIGDRSLHFQGQPSGEVVLERNGTGHISEDVAAGRYETTLSGIDRRLTEAGYRLTSIQCDDHGKATRSQGNLEHQSAIFAVNPGETVTCTFLLALPSACACPKAGRWQVNNHTGRMTCSGPMPMAMPLAPAHSTGTLTPNAGCTQILAQGMSDDEADIQMHLQPDCSWKGSFGGTRDIPATIDFHWTLESQTRITGNLSSNFSQQGMSCSVSRTFELDFGG